MSSLNKVQIIGNLGSDPERRSLPSGEAVSSFSVATSKKWKDKSGQMREVTEWHRVVCFGNLADLTCQYLARGKKVFVEGELRTQKWEKDGIKREKTEIVARDVIFLDPAGSSQNQDGYQQNAPAPRQASPASPPADDIDFDDDIPF